MRVLAEHRRQTQWGILLSAFGALTLCASCAPTRPVCMAGGHRDASGRCTQNTPIHQLPFRQGFETRVMQGFHGAHSHADDQPYAIDFLCDEGDAIVATRSAVVWEVKEDSLSGCADASCDGDANYVLLDHGDGTYTGYHHLAPMGALVEPGQKVCRGQVIGVCGVTGYTTGAHLHWELSDSAHKTIPARFVEAHRHDPIGYPLPGVGYTSENERQLRCDEVEPSRFARDAFAHQGILLKQPLDRVFTRGDSRRVVEGTYYGEMDRVALSRKLLRADEEVWVTQCAPVASDGSFRMVFDWEDAVFEAGVHWFMLAGATSACESSGWSWSYRARLDGEASRPAEGPALPPQRDALRMPD